MTAINLGFRQEYARKYKSMFSIRISNSLAVGQIIDMLVVGLTCDLINRKRTIIFTTLFMVMDSIIAAVALGKLPQHVLDELVMHEVTRFGVGKNFYIECNYSRSHRR